MERFTRTRTFLGDEKFNLLQNSSVTIVGIGAVGGYAMEALARSGIGSLQLVDFDIVQQSNINRQIIALENTIGTPKVEAAKERVLAINPECQVTALKEFAAEESLDRIFQHIPDLVIDCIDSMNPKIQLLAGAHSRSIPTLCSMGAALRSDPSQVKVDDLSRSTNCPLAKRVRKMLRRHYQIETGIQCVYSTEKVDFTYELPQDEELPAPFSDRGRKRNVLGSLPTVTGIFGLTLANMAILQLTDYNR